MRQDPVDIRPDFTCAASETPAMKARIGHACASAAAAPSVRKVEHDRRPNGAELGDHAQADRGDTVGQHAGSGLRGAGPIRCTDEIALPNWVSGK
jgi:hypothetical protein